MAYFRPIDTTMDEEQVQLCRKEKLRCACRPPAPQPLVRSRGVGRAREGRVRGPSYSPSRGHCSCVSR